MHELGVKLDSGDALGGQQSLLSFQVDVTLR